MRRRRRQRAMQCRRDARPSDTAFARVESTPPSAKRHQSITPPVATLASASSVPASIIVIMYRENDRRSSRESFLRYRSGVRNISKTLAGCIANSEPRQIPIESRILRMSKEVGSRRPEGFEPLNHSPGILSCHSSTPLKSYWCDGTLSSSRGHRRTKSHSFQCSLDSKVEGTLTKVLAVSLCFVIDLQRWRSGTNKNDRVHGIFAGIGGQGTRRKKKRRKKLRKFRGLSSFEFRASSS